ncbi:MAG: hypothetical protein J6W19_07975 [Prevotella sp.]|nr:hypothetical protein [Prevotella sp.]
MKTIIATVLLAAICMTANAQIGKVLNKVIRQTEEVVNEAVNKVTETAENIANVAEKEVRDVLNDEDSLLYGDHKYSMQGNIAADKYRRNGFGIVTFTYIPSNYEEFKAVYTNFLGKTAFGAAAMMPMAMEMYARDREVGRQCIELLCYPSNVNSVISIIKEKFGSNPNDSYGQRYLPAASLKGATPENAYQPERPYTVQMEASVNQHQELKITGSGTVLYLYIMGGGWDTHQRSVEVIKQPGKDLYQVFNCPSLYTGCKQIVGTWAGLE